jgi:enoyl-CoA hydratase/carnithine racemase
VKIGLFCSTPMVPVARAIGRKRALEMLFTGEMIDAATAAGWGLVNRVVPPERLDAEVTVLAEQIAGASASVLALGKRTFYEQDALREADAYAITAPVMAENAQTGVAREGMQAFLDKRSPEWPEGA